MRSNLSSFAAAIASLGLMALVCAATGCEVHEHGHYDQVDLVDVHGYHHTGYYDEHHDWHGGYYDENHAYHDDPHDWQH